ncbi:FtsX-like permease family protein [Paenibacillus flagellatus]|uniref:Peptide ABC transporter permease n=1 Tax=Paenibacillus flagellatus TaxID=2211139 RepID=A0A2V5KCC4_9BACL|nr:FtsX-like permease family protein [Paenibacillus flagellatus]PYI57255.1 peptide ABC transporter permease [Paenibacillus flagellatus]
MNVWSIAWRNLKRRKLRTLLTFLSIVIGVASTFAVIASVDSAKKVFPLYLKAAFGKADYQLLGTEAYFSEQIFREAAAKLDGTIAIAVAEKNTKLHLEREDISAIQKRVDLTGYSRLDTPLTGFKTVKGSLTGEGAVITDRTARVWRVDVGDTIAFNTDDGVRTIPVSAIVRYTVELMGPSSWTMAKYHPWSVAVPLPVLQEWFGMPGQIDGVQIKLDPNADADAFGQRIDAFAKSHDGIFAQPIVLDFDEFFQGVDTFFLALYLAGFLGIALSAFIMFNSFYVGVKERRNEFAALKTIGYTPEQLRAFVLIEALLLAAAGTAVGLIAGYGLAIGLKTVIFLIFSVHDDSGMTLAKGLAVATLAGLLVPVAASLYPMRQAGRTSVIGALKESGAGTGPRPFRIWQAPLGVVLIGSAFFIKHLLLLVPLLTGVALVFPFLFRAFVALLGPVYRSAFGFGGAMAARNLKRNPARTAMTSVILCMGIAMIVLMSSLNSALLQTYERIIYASYGGNLDVELHHIEKTDLERIRAIDGVADAQTYPLHGAIWSLNGQKRKLPVYGVGAEWIDRFPLFAATGQTRGELIGRLAKDEIVLDKIAFNIWGGRIGETVRLETKQGMRDFKVAAVVDTMKNSGFGAFLEEETFRDSFGLKYERNALVIKDDSITPVQLRERVFEQFGERIEEMFGPEDWVSIVGATFTGSFSIINGLVVLSIVISGIGITNTLLMNIMERVRELGMMRAVGVTRRQVVGMVIAEGLGIGLAATIVGCLFGILLIYMTSTFLEVNALTYRFGVSWTIVAIIALFGVAVSLASSFAPASRAAKTRLSEALRYE